LRGIRLKPVATPAWHFANNTISMVEETSGKTGGTTVSFRG
jgi:hypothetical protein